MQNVFWKTNFAVAMVALVLTGCNSADQNPIHQAVVTLGVLEPSPQPPVVVAVLVDPTPGSVSRTQADATSQQLLEFIAHESPGSELRIYGLQHDFAHSSTPVLVLQVPRPSMSGDRARRAMQTKFLAEAKPKLAVAFEQVFSNIPQRSPVAPGVVVAAIASRPSGARMILLVLSDGREEDEFGHFECASLPTPRFWQSRLREAGLFLPDQLKNAKVIFAFFTPRPVDRDRCSQTMSRFLAVRELWRSVIEGSGGTVLFKTDGVSEQDLEEELLQ